MKGTFALVDGADLESELLAHYSRYLAVRLAGFAEQSLKDLVSAHARRQSSPQVHRFVESRIRLLWGINKWKLKETLDSMDPAWWVDLDNSHNQELESLHSVGKLRDNVSHGGDSGISMPIVRQYRDDVFRLYDRLCELLDP